MVYEFLVDYRAKPVDGPEHESLRSELWIGGADLACCYYLCMLTEKDYSASPLTEVRQDIAAYILQHASAHAIAFIHAGTSYAAEFALPFLKEQFSQAFHIAPKLTKPEKGMILLLRHPQWSDERIRVALKTTEKQMSRWSWYRLARAIQSRHGTENSTATGRPTPPAR